MEPEMPQDEQVEATPAAEEEPAPVEEESHGEEWADAKQGEELDWEDKKGMDPDLWLNGPDQIRDVDVVTRQHCVESILLLCAAGRKARETLRLARTYVILRQADMVEESERVSERISECVNFLRRDEEGTEEGSSDQRVAEAYGGGGGGDGNVRLAIEAGPSIRVSMGDGDEDDFDGVD